MRQLLRYHAWNLKWGLGWEWFNFIGSNWNARLDNTGESNISTLNRLAIRKVALFSFLHLLLPHTNCTLYTSFGDFERARRSTGIVAWKCQCEQRWLAYWSPKEWWGLQLQSLDTLFHIGLSSCLLRECLPACAWTLQFECDDFIKFSFWDCSLTPSLYSDAIVFLIRLDCIASIWAFSTLVCSASFSTLLCSASYNIWTGVNNWCLCL